MIPVDDHGLTAHEIDVLAAYGRTGRISSVAQSMGISVQTVKNTLSLVYRILEVPGIAAALWKVFVDDKDQGKTA